MPGYANKVKALYAHPFPEFELKAEKWLGVSFGAGKFEENPHDVPLIGFVFDEHGYAAQINNLILSWTNGELVDKSKSIRVAVIEDSPSSYIFFCHPNFNHPAAAAFYKSAEESSAKKGFVPEREALPR